LVIKKKKKIGLQRRVFTKGKKKDVNRKKTLGGNPVLRDKRERREQFRKEVENKGGGEEGL